jgi:hypothetical protein
MSPYKFLLPSDDRQCAQDDIYRLVLLMELAYRFFEDLFQWIWLTVGGDVGV